MSDATEPRTEADEVISDGVQEHRSSQCRWTASRIYPGHEACLVNGAAHYREAEADHE